MRLVEIRLLEGPNLYRLGPAARIEVAIERRRAWRGSRTPTPEQVVRLGAPVSPTAWPDHVAGIVAWARRLRADHGEGVGGVAVHRTSDVGHWVVAFPWTGAERTRAICEAAVALTDRSVTPARRARLTGAQERLLERLDGRVAAAPDSRPAWIRDGDRRMPIVSVTGTNGKSTVTRLISHILVLAGRHVGATTSDGVLVNGRLVEPGDWTGPGGAAQVLGRGDVDVAVLETARGGILLRGIGYESNEVSVLTNVSSDHLDLQGIHTLPELAEVKATLCRITKPSGWTILNGDDPLVAAVARRVRAHVALFTLDAERSPAMHRHLARGGRVYLARRGVVAEAEGGRETPIVDVRDVPIAVGGLARYNVANVLAAAGGARALGASIEQVASGLRDFRPTSERSPGRLNLFRLGSRLIVVDFAHNEAGAEAILDLAEAIAGGAAGRAAPITAIIGTAGDRPDDSLRGIGRIAARRAQRVAIKETPHYLRGRSRESVVEALRAGIRAGGGDPRDVPVYESETAALRGELAMLPSGSEGRPEAGRIIVLFCHEERAKVFRLLDSMGARPVDVAAELTELVPRLQDRPRRG